VVLVVVCVVAAFPASSVEAQPASAAARIRKLIQTTGGEGCGNLDPTAAAALEIGRHVMDRAATKLAMSTFADVSLSEGPGSIPTNGASLEVSKAGDTIGKAQLAWHGTNDALSLTLKGPLNSSGQGNAVVSPNLQAGAGWNVGYTHTFWGRQSEEGKKLRTALTSANCNTAALIRDDADAIAFALGHAVLTNPEDLSETLHPGSGGRSPNDTLQQIADRFVAASLLTVSQALTATFNYGEARQDYTYITPTNLTQQTEHDKSFERSVAVAYGRTHTFEKDGTQYQWPQFSVGVGGRWTTGQKAGTVRNICTPFADGATQCQNIATSAPTPTETRELRLDVRQWSYPDKLAVNPNYVRDFENQTDKAEFLVSFLQLTKKDLGPGVPNYILDNTALSVGARFGHVWDRKPGKPDEGNYFIIFFAASLGAWNY
jgi:hypothetical protein